MATITKIFKPRRGLKSTMAGSKASTVLSSGEMFVECQGSTVGKGKVKVKIGDGSTAYSSLDYALGDTSTDPISFSNNSSSTASAALDSVASGNSLQTIVGGLKQAAALNASSISKLNDENLINTNSINSINSSISSLNTKVSTNTNNINSINTILSSGIGDTYSYIKVFVLNSAITTVAAFIDDKCYGVSIVKDGIAIIQVSKAETYIIKAYDENTNGTYNPRIMRTTTVTITNPNSVVTVVIDTTYGENGKFGNLSFANTTNEQFANIVSALDEGKLTVNDLPWKVNDRRTVLVSPMPATYVGESQPKQIVMFVIQNIGGITLTDGNPCHYVIGFFPLANPGYMNPTDSTSNSWEKSARRKWCNEIFKNAIPEPIKSCFKQFKCITATGGNSNTVTTTDDYFALPAEKEVKGYSSYSLRAEADVLTQFTWYKTASNISGDIRWTRSPLKSDLSYFCWYKNDSGNVYTDYTKPNQNCFISPFGCI